MAIPEAFYTQAQLLSVLGQDTYFRLVILFSSVFIGILACTTVYNIMNAAGPLVSVYSKLSKAEKIEWGNRGFSTAHSIMISAAAIYFIFFSDLFKDASPYGPVVFRSSLLSEIILGISVGYFIADLSMILWFYPTLGGKEYIVHHGLSVVSLTLSIYGEEGIFYVYMLLLSESTTPFVNLRWYLCTMGLKKSTAYIVNGIFLFLGWMLARILLFVFFFLHLYKHYDQVQRMHAALHYCVLLVPPCLAVLNVAWFLKILMGLLKIIFSKL
ncbi:hypothetical protein KP509_21G082200 [Ceratopteris richardii]|uniref:TLC domain-containing protein n=1 Tax=Ceratopteris richardii TaxID=49495 RepID=A0A8T2SDZ7_CERRI|nr:hypothetical protein KP509_21G082200 [Ceratopteris richardii]KAH7316196.1 hypothetical protein KP509_21G082200 [Ceratopteris richardii]